MYVQGMRLHIKYLSEYIALSSPKLYLEMVAWAKIMLISLRFRVEDIQHGFDLLSDEMQSHLPPEDGKLVAEYIEQGKKTLICGPIETPSFIDPSNHSDKIAYDYLELLLRCDEQGAMELISECMKAGEDAGNVYINVFQKTQNEIGRLWQIGKINVGQEHYCAAANQIIISKLYPKIWSSKKNRVPRPCAIVACVEGELHEFGARMVADLLELDGWDVQYLGANWPMPSIIQMVNLRRPELLLLSATMINNVNGVTDIIHEIDKDVRSNGLKILVGGYPFKIDNELWKTVGADGFATDAKMAIEICNGWLVKDNDQKR